MSQNFLLEFLRTYPTKRIAAKLLQRETVILLNADKVAHKSLALVLQHLEKLAFDPLVVIQSSKQNTIRESVQHCLLKAEEVAGATKLPILHGHLHNHGVVPCIKSTETGWKTGCEVSIIKDLMEKYNVSKVYRFKDQIQQNEKKFIQQEGSDDLTNLLLQDNTYNSTVVDVPVKLPGEVFRHCTNGKLQNGIEYRRGIQVSKNEFESLHLKQLLENSFQKRFKSWKEYEQGLRESSVYVAGNYFGTAIVHSLLGKVSYLDKFAVQKEQQSSGVAELLWNHLRSNHKTLAWRSRSDNPANSWYLGKSDGSFSLNDKWKLFWYGNLDLHGVDHLHQLVEEIPSTFSEENFSK
eukprot:NODE_55_length_29507_cov_0.809712.p9 type:complete len:351 gc:universal NODE_55_length_29507_cov_0.809712:12537-13589(+)